VSVGLEGNVAGIYKAGEALWASQAVVAAAQKRVFDVNLREPFVEQQAILACMQVRPPLRPSSCGADQPLFGQHVQRKRPRTGCLANTRLEYAPQLRWARGLVGVHLRRFHAETSSAL
jgi:hypothetical protein